MSFGTVMTHCLGCRLQYQLVSNSIEQRYCNLTTNSTGVIIFPSIVVFYCSLYAPDMKRMTLNPLVDVSVVFMESYFTD